MMNIEAGPFLFIIYRSSFIVSSRPWLLLE